MVVDFTVLLLESFQLGGVGRHFLHLLLDLVERGGELATSGIGEIGDYLLDAVHLLLALLDGVLQVADVVGGGLGMLAVGLARLYQLLVNVLQSGEFVFHSLYRSLGLRSVARDMDFCIHRLVFYILVQRYEINGRWGGQMSRRGEGIVVILRARMKILINELMNEDMNEIMNEWKERRATCR